MHHEDLLNQSIWGYAHSLSLLASFALVLFNHSQWIKRKSTYRLNHLTVILICDHYSAPYLGESAEQAQRFIIPRL
jgi:hypothetical protein